MKKSEIDFKAQREQQENEILRRVLYWLGAAVILEAFVLFSNRYSFTNVLVNEVFFAARLRSVFEVLQYLGFVVAAALLIWGILARRKDEKRGIFRVILGAFFAMIGFTSLLFVHVGEGSVPILLVFIPAAAGLVLIYYLYQREFFVVALQSGIGVLGLWIIRSASSRFTGFFYVYAIGAACLMAITVLLTVAIQKNEGSLKLGEKMIPIFKKGASYHMIWITAALVVATLLIALFVGAGFAYYAVLGMVVWLLVMAVFFTSRLM